MLFVSEVVKDLLANLAHDPPMHVVHDVLERVRPVLRLHIASYSSLSLFLIHHDFRWQCLRILVRFSRCRLRRSFGLFGLGWLLFGDFSLCLIRLLDLLLLFCYSFTPLRG